MTYHTQWRSKNLSARQKYEAAYRKKNAVRLAAYHRQWRVSHPASLRKRHLHQAYGLTPEDFDKLLLQQNGRCGICKTTKPGGRGIFNVDHDHTTGVVRGLLCHQCNTGCGKFKDNSVLLAIASAWCAT